MTLKVSDNQYGRPHPSDSWDFCFVVQIWADMMYDMMYGF